MEAIPVDGDMTLDAMAGLTIDSCPCGRPHSVPTRQMAVEAGALARLQQLVDRWIGPGAVLIAADRNTWAAAGRRAAGLLEGDGRRVAVHLLDETVSPAHADAATVEALSAAIRRESPAGIVAVGAGTVNDVSKAASTGPGLPLITVATAASMNGYTSAIAALTVDGLKVTDFCNPPVAVIADPEIIQTAPRRLNAAGFGDLLSKNASTADWVMCHLLLDDYFCEVPVRVVERAVEASIREAPAIRENESGGLAVLSDALLRSGISMVLAGSSSPASGGEHLISHLWDMTAHWSDRQPALHGEQTGVTTLISLALYEKLLALDAAAVKRLEARPAFGSEAEMEEKLGAVFRELTPSILPQARQKYLDADGLRTRRDRIADRWEAIRQAVGRVVIAPALSRRYLQAAGAVVTTGALGISGDELRFACRNARWIRNRYTVLDLAAEIGVLDVWMEEILEASGVV